MGLDDRLEYEDNVVGIVEKFHNPKGVIDDLRKQKFYFGFDTRQLRNMYSGLRRDIERNTDGENKIDLSLCEDTLALWDYQLSVYVLREEKQLKVEQIQRLSEETMLRLALDYVRESDSEELRKILESRDRLLDTMRRCSSDTIN